MKGAKELAGILRHMRDHLPLDDIQKGILRESAAHLDAKAAIDSAVTGDIEEIRMQELIAARSDALKSANTALAAENARLVNEHAAAMSRADVLAEGVRLFWGDNGWNAAAALEWKRKHGNLVGDDK